MLAGGVAAVRRRLRPAGFIELAGLAAIVAGIGMLYVPAAVIAAGIGMVLWSQGAQR